MTAVAGLSTSGASSGQSGQIREMTTRQSEADTPPITAVEMTTCQNIPTCLRAPGSNRFSDFNALLSP